MTLYDFKRIYVYKQLNDCQVSPRKSVTTPASNETMISFDVMTAGMDIKATRRVVVRKLRPYDNKYMLQIKFGRNIRQYNGLFAHLMFNLCEKKHNAR